MLFTNLNYNKQVNGVRNTVDFQNINQFLTVRMFENPNENLSGNINLDKTIKKIKYQIELGFNHSNFIQEINSTLQTNKNDSYDYQLGFTTLFDKFPTIELGLKTTIGKFTSSENTSKFVTTQPFLNIDYAFSKGFIFNFEYIKSNYQNKNLGQKNSYEIANTTFSYRGENSGWLFKISAQNLFDAQFKQSNSFSNYIISDTKTFILPRIVLFSIGYNL
jgi:predicted adenine nucleotide alpha hydrolase (AANH) superfamily ATPase